MQARAWSCRWFVGIVSGLSWVAASPGAGGAEQIQAREILAVAGVQGGLIVHIGCGDGRLTAALRVNDSFLVQGLDVNAANVEIARKHLQALGLYGRVSAASWDGRRLPYINNFVNLCVVRGPSSVDRAELLRVLCPGGVAVFTTGQGTLAGDKLVKPRPQEIDDWTHYLHGPDNNAVAQDTVVGPPKHYQWIGSPDYLRHHDHMSGLSAMVSANGRLFYVMDLGPRWSIQMPPQWTLLARDAFNGTVLWQRPIERWHPHLWPLKRGPAQLMRRLVADEETVYVTLGVGAPVTALAAASGQTIRAYAGTEGAEEIIQSDGVLYTVVNPELDAYQTIAQDTVETIRSAGREWNWDEKPRRLVAAEAGTGRTLWSGESVVAPSTLAVGGGRVYFHDGERIICLDANDGQRVWVSKPLPRWKPMHVLFSPTLVVYQDVVLFAGGEKLDPQRGGRDSMTALSAASGEVLWTGEHPPSGYASAEDLFAIDGLVWCGVTSSPRDSGVFTGRDLHTGEVKVQFPPDDWKHMPHHRCHRAKATSNFILTSRTGIEFVDIDAQHWTAHHWVRGSCNYGVMPCNGLLYAPPHSCACYLLAKLNGFNALAPERGREAEGGTRKEANRLERGPAYEALPDPSTRLPPPSADWPTFRHDTGRSGATKATVPAELSRLWQTAVGGRLSALTMADGKVFVASVDAHTVYALDAGAGKPLWSFTAGGRVDSPPTVWQGRVLFGSADGHVYALCAADGLLAWRFRAASEDQRMMAREQLESVWPVHGSVLVRDGVVYAVAGRAMWLDGGLRLLRLDAATGRMLSETVLDDKYPGTQDNLQRDLKWPNLPVALPDILSCDSRYVYMRSQPFDFDGRRPEVPTPRNYREQRGETAHLFSPTGFLDDTWWHRTYWMWGRSFISAAGGWQLATYQTPAGKILVCDETSVYGFGPAPLRFLGTPMVHHLFACRKEPQIIHPNPKQPPRKQGTSIYGEVFTTRLGYDWSQAAPLLARGLVLAGDTLFAAGPPVMVDELEEAYLNYGAPQVQAKMAEHTAAFDGKRGALLMAVSKHEGQTRAAYRLDSPPVFDGLIAADRRLFMATRDGHVLCLGAGSGTPLHDAPDAKLSPMKETATSAADRRAAAKMAFHPTEAHPDFQKISAVQIRPSKRGYHLQTTAGTFGVALKKLDPPITKRGTFRVKVVVRPDAPTPDTPGNGFLVFGDQPDESQLVMCGYRISGKSLAITQAGKPRGTPRKADLQAKVETQLDVVVDLAAQKVTFSAAGETIEAQLDPPIQSIAWVGCAVQSVDADFSPLEISREHVP
ncbi:MAG: PQQ-binding-like beta-propeller repeat protein [Candidatus Anammoximicrobium sp.]|nr:PQQ-binding-like beta-propeller repeat protein [Candidatus Anammoximicrobium sp.]